MKIRWVEAVNFRKFVQPVRVGGIGDGINVLVGLNETGKSTLMEAINAVVFEKARAQTHQTRSFRHFANRTIPEVSLGFELNSKTWTIRKRFAGQAGKAFLESSDGRRFEDEEAETELQRLLGFTIAGRSAEPGIWGTLWVRQGHSFGGPAIDERARQTLQGCLEAQVGAVTGGLRGQRIPEAIESALAAIVSTRGPRGRYKDVSDQLVAAEAQVVELEAKRNHLYAEMERLAGLRRDLQNLEADWDGEENKRQTDAARKKHAEAEKRAEQIRTAQSEAALATERSQRARARVEARMALVAEIGELEVTVGDLRQGVTAAESAKNAAAAMLAEKEQDLHKLNEQERQTTETGRRLLRIRDVVLLNADIERNEGVVKQIEEKQEEAARLAEQIGGIAATPDGVAKIQAAELELTKATAVLNAVATTVALTIEGNAVSRVKLGGKPIDEGEISRAIIDNLVIDIDGVGEIEVRPNVKDREAVVTGIDRAERALRVALESAGVENLSAALVASSRRQDLERRLEALRNETRRLAPGDKASKLAPGVDALRIRIEELRGRRDAEMTSLGREALPELETIESQIRQNATEAERLAAEIKAAEAGLAGPKDSVEQTREVFETLRRNFAAEIRDLETKNATVAEDRKEASDTALEAKAIELEGLAEARWMAATNLEHERGEAAEDIVARIRRLENAARAYREQSTNLRTDIARASGLITANEGDGIEEKLDAARAEQARLDAEARNYAQEVAVLELLRDTLRVAESEAKARYLAPVVTRVEPYLKMLLPGTDLVLNEDLHIAGVKRNGVEEEFATLSHGTQEQIAVLVRLAFAELLLDQGRPATVILDDALVFSDDDRIEHMFDIMTRAAERMQIIILTCRKRLFTRLGAPMLRIEGA
jgi:DNA repair exonuclease SbcCD ATPase subunit